MLSLNVGNPQPQPTNNFGQQNTGFESLLGFGTSTPPPQQPVANNQNNGGFNLLGNDFLGMGGQSTQPAQQPVTNVAQNTGFNFNQPTNQNQGFNWGLQPTQAPQNQVNQAQQNPNKFLAYDNPQIQIWMNCIK